MKRQFGNFDWNYYYKSHYHPIRRNWSKTDFAKYQSWYYTWIRYIDNILHFKNNGNKTAFEIGSGIGAVSSLLHDYGLNITASEISTDMIKIAKKISVNTHFVYCDIQDKLPSKDSYFDYIFAFEVLEHLNNPLKSIKIIYNKLKPGGIFCGTTPYPFRKNYLDPSHVFLFSPYVIERLFSMSGFKNITLRPMSFLPYVWKIHKKLNIVLPFYVPLPYFVSTTLIIAKR